MTADVVGVVDELWRFPVKSMGGEKLEKAPVSDHGVLGDRAAALLDLETNELVSASNRHFPGLMDWRATYVEPPEGGRTLPPIRITGPDGASALSGSPALADLLSSRFGRPVSLVRVAPDGYRRKQAAFFAGIGLDCLAPSGSLVDLCPLSVISRATLDELSRSRPSSSFDPRRFRMNVLITTTGGGFVEHAWQGRWLTLGQVRLRIALPDPRCVMTTLPQDGLPKDPAILRTVAEMNSLPVGTGGPQPCAGVYATVARSGLVGTGDRVLLTDA
jgi:uncharacterized protein YcbX